MQKEIHTINWLIMEQITTQMNKTMTSNITREVRTQMKGCSMEVWSHISENMVRNIRGEIGAQLLNNDYENRTS